MVASCPDAPADSGLFPLLVLVAGERGPVHEDTVLAAYLVSHGYVVATLGSRGAGLATRPSLERLLTTLRVLRTVDSRRIAVAGRGAGAVRARDLASRWTRVGALIEFDPLDRAMDSTGPLVSRLPALVVVESIGAVSSPSPSRLLLHTPPGAERRRLVPALTHVFLSAALRGWGDSLEELAARLRRLGL